MTLNGWLQIGLFSLLVILIARPLGGYMTRIFAGERTFLTPVLRPLERGIYWACGVDEQQEQHWLIYAAAMLLFSLVGFLSLYALQRLQAMLPFNPQGQSAVEQTLAFNTSISFITNTNWQSYVPETTMSYLVQMAGLTVHNFLSAATGIALALALIRGFVRREAKTVGNFWVDLTRCTLYLLLPVAIVGTLVFVWQGVPQNLAAYTDVTTLEGAKQTIAQGPVASQEIIKIFGTNGGGFFNANSAHPFENPTALTNLIQTAADLLDRRRPHQRARPHGGKDERQGWAVFAAMGILFLAGVTTLLLGRSQRQSGLRPSTMSTARPVTCRPAATWRARRSASAIANSALFATVTTDTSCGAVNSAMARQLHAVGGASSRCSTSSWAR